MLKAPLFASLFSQSENGSLRLQAKWTAKSGLKGLSAAFLLVWLDNSLRAMSR
jgi:hypothetical protein